ncbi:phosphate ABC transporter permease PstA [Aliiglaciecola sp. CAU 1673]|uniref:phosphate ABC transporter permease PstA n=1 Tax=Aliiglaciecola sp. CAU 1673 TaxID=3032595 RepID=UPI0023DCDC71|nr:phosphate ABC transporter permease PstA [Aliiglaciecola sp. CAU 1673]MDF2179425.1 phosphate ABC transporter permease PstA [Aliiglaciecola sp. CAU 1673]
MSESSRFRGLREGLPVVSSAAVVAVMLLALLGMVGIMLIKGMTHFWPSQIYELKYDQHGQQNTLFATLLSEDFTIVRGQSRWLFNQASLYQFSDQQHLIEERSIVSLQPLPALADIQLRNGNRLFAELQSIVNGDEEIAEPEIAQVRHLVEQKVLKLQTLESGRLATIHLRLNELNLRGVEEDAPAKLRLQEEFTKTMSDIGALQQELARYRMVLRFANGERYELPLAQVEEYYQPNQFDFWQELGWCLGAMWDFVSEKPKRANSAGGVFPALFGTVVMVLMMTLLVTPLGVMAAIYLNEYAPDNWLTSFIRVGVNNLAGVPSIVYGVFGLGFLVYQVGGSIDALFFSEHLPAPTFGAPGIFWASVTMAMLTLPVVIVATEEGLRRVPNSLRQGSYALGATKYETLWRTVIPMASPGIMTGVILAIARGAGEVAPLLLVGAVKFAPSLPIDGEFPFLHLDRQFMHLGVLIYDGAFHSNNIGHGSSMMFASCLLLLLVVLLLNISAIWVRARLRRLYQNLLR